MDQTLGSFVPRSSQGLSATKKRESRRNGGSWPAACGQSQTVLPPGGREFLDAGGDPGFDEFGRVKRIRTQRDGQTIMVCVLSSIPSEGTHGASDTEGSQTKTRVYVQDANWNVAAVYDSSDNTDSLELITYTPYGKPTFWKKVSGTWQEQSQLSSRKGADHLFQGRWLCAYESSGLRLQLYHFRHRAYSPILGRFLQRDPYGDIFEYSSHYLSLRGSPLGYLDPSGLLSSRRRLHGKGWSIVVDSTCRRPCCNLTAGDVNLDRLLQIAFDRLPKSTATGTVQVDIRQCMREKLQSGKLKIICHKADEGTRCDKVPKRRGFILKLPGRKHPNEIHICCDNFIPYRRKFLQRQTEHQLAKILIHELSHLCGAEDPPLDESGEPVFGGPIVIERRPHFPPGDPTMAEYARTFVERRVLPNAYDIERELVPEFSPDDYALSGLRRIKKAEVGQSRK